MKTQQSVLIVGAGPTGLAAAVELYRLGVPARIISKAPHLAPDCRATWVHSTTLDLLDASGAAERIADAGTLQRYFVIHDINALEHKVDMSLVGGKHPYAVVVSQANTERVLNETLENLGGKVELNTELIDIDQSNDAVHCRIRLPSGEEQCVTYDHVIGADGSYSTVRKLSGIEFEGDTTDRDWTVSMVRMHWPYPICETHSFVQEDGFLMVFRMQDGLYRVMTNDGEIERRLPKGARLLQMHKNTTFRVRHMQAKRYQDRRVYLAGDAAHVHSPYGGRGMNLGIADGVCLARLLAQSQQSMYTQMRYNAAKASVMASRDEWEFVHSAPRWRKQLMGYVMWLMVRIPMMHRMISEKANGKA